MKTRSMRQAAEDGNYFLITDSRNGYEYDYPAAETPHEAMGWLKTRMEAEGRPIPKGTMFYVYRVLPGSRIGARFLKVCNPILA